VASRQTRLTFALRRRLAQGRVALGVFLSSQFPMRPSQWMTKVTVLLLTSSIRATFMFGSPVSKTR